MAFLGIVDLESIYINSFDTNNVINHWIFTNVPNSVKITTNSSTATWLNTNYPSYTNIVII